MVATTHDGSVLFLELGLAIVGLALLARLANRWGFSAIPLYLVAGLAFGNGGQQGNYQNHHGDAANAGNPQS